MRSKVLGLWMSLNPIGAKLQRYVYATFKTFLARLVQTLDEEQCLSATLGHALTGS